MAHSVMGFLFLVLTTSLYSVVFGSLPPIHDQVLFPRFTEFPDTPQTEFKPFAELPYDLFRLPNKIVPRHYKLEIRPILNEGEVGRFTAPGTVQITVECLEATNSLVLHALELNINETTVKVWETDNTTNLLPITGTSFQTDNQTYTIDVGVTLTVGIRYDIYIEYVARMPEPTERMSGLYLSSYQTETNEKRYLATTQFSRRRAFRNMLPSFDEPSQKASFEISVGRQSPYHTLSNMNIRAVQPIADLPGWTWDRYHITPVMPPTVIAIIVSDFANETANPDLFHPTKPIKIWGPPTEMKNGAAAFAAEAAAKTLKYFEDYFEIEYELPKMDCAAVPDFEAGAMENWGLNTYRTIYLIWLQGVNTMAEKFRVANIIGHEFAHQYWGNLVTHAWWNDWWLTEGTASYFEYNSVQAIYPEFDALNRIITSDLQPALEFDAGPNSMPVHGNETEKFVENPSTINYNKGASLVRMMQTFLTENVFKQALTHYLTKERYKAVDQDVFFNDITEFLVANDTLPSNGLSIKEIMDTWTLQTSFPLVRVSAAGENRIFISQERFTNAALRQTVKEQGTLWHVPVGIVTQSNPSFAEDNLVPKMWIDKGTLVTNYEINTNQWIVVNPDGRGYYRVLYDSSLELLLRTQLKANISSISVGSRSMIVDDYFTSAYQGYIRITDALTMTEFILNETDYNVWVPFLKHLRKAFNMFLSDTNELNMFKTYILKSMEVALNQIGYTQLVSEPPTSTILRVQLFDWACALGSVECETEANRLFALWQADPSVNPVPVDIRPQIYCAASASSEANWDLLLKLYDDTKDVTARNALACNDALLARILDKVLAVGDVPQQDMAPLISRVAMNSNGRELTITFLNTNFVALIAPEKIGVKGIADVISTLSSYVRATAQTQMVQKFIADHTTELTPEIASINASLARILANTNWMTNFGNDIVTWLNNRA